MDHDHTQLAWPSLSYDNLYYRQEYYESVVMSSQTVDQTRSIPTLIHKVNLRISRPHRRRRADSSMGN
jgi:hypothetical protein